MKSNSDKTSLGPIKPVKMQPVKIYPDLHVGFVVDYTSTEIATSKIISVPIVAGLDIEKGFVEVHASPYEGEENLKGRFPAK